MFKILISILIAFGSIFSGIYDLARPMPDVNPGGFRVHYTEAKHAYMDVYLPEDTAGTKNVMIAVHGGSWMLGNQTSFAYDAQDAAAHGYIGVTVDYSKILDKATAADMVNELHAAVKSLKDALDARGIKAGKLILYSHSSGSHLALLYAYQHHADSAIPIGFLVALSSPADLTLEAGGKTVLERGRSSLLTALTHENITDRTLKTAKAQAAVHAINPIDLVTPDVPPTLLAHGDDDDVVAYENSVRLCEKLKANGVASELVTYPGEGHFIRFSPIEMRQALMQRVLEWTKIYL